MQPIKKMRISSIIVEAINEMIIDENIQLGDKLPSENELAKRLEVSRTSVREAIRTLEFQGRVKVKQGKGIFLSETVIGWFKRNQESIEELFEVRILVESHTASRAAKTITEKDLRILGQIQEEYEIAIRDKKIGKSILLDKKFHNQIALSSGNSTLKQIMETIVSELSRGWICSLQIPERQQTTVTEHRDILNALISHDMVVASSKMEMHLKKAFRDIEKHYKEETI